MKYTLSGGQTRIQLDVPFEWFGNNEKKDSRSKGSWMGPTMISVVQQQHKPWLAFWYALLTSVLSHSEHHNEGSKGFPYNTSVSNCKQSSSLQTDNEDSENAIDESLF